MEMKDLCNDFNHNHEHNQQNHFGMKMHNHEGALVCSVEKEVVGELESVKDIIANELYMFAEWVEEEDGVVGHIKAFIEKSGSGYLLSTTGGIVDSKATRRSSIYISIVAIIFNLNEKKLKCRMASIVNVV